MIVLQFDVELPAHHKPQAHSIQPICASAISVLHASATQVLRLPASHSILKVVEYLLRR
jgi:hypothetical protein